MCEQIEKEETKLFQFFPLRTDIINNNYNDIYETYGNLEKFVELFRNDLLQFIVQNSIGSVNINTIKDYKGYSVSDSVTVEKVRGLKRCHADQPDW